MKVTTELKNLIKDEFEERRKKLKAKHKEEVEKRINDINVGCRNDARYIQAINLLEQLADECRKKIQNNDFLNRGSWLEMIDNREYKSWVCENFSYNKTRQDQLDLGNEILALIKQEQSLLIKLTYEKDLEVIKNMLMEYNINIL